MLVYGLECLAKAQRTLAYMHHIIILYSYWLGSRTTAVFLTRGRTCSRIKQKCCGPRSLSMTVLLYTFILSKFSYSWSLFPLTYPIDVPSRPRILTSPLHCDVNITWLIEPMKIGPSVNSWPVNWTVLQRIWIFLLTVKMLYIYCIGFIQ